MKLSLTVSAVVDIPEDIRRMLGTEENREKVRQHLVNRAIQHMFSEFGDEDGIVAADVKFLPDEN